MQTSGYIHPGQLNRKVKLYKNTTVKTDSGEAEHTETLVKEVMYAKRDEFQGSEEDSDGRVIGLGVVAYTVRFTTDVFTNGQQYFVRDFDGDYHINSVELAGQQRNRFLKLKCTRRGN